MEPGEWLASLCGAEMGEHLLSHGRDADATVVANVLAVAEGAHSLAGIASDVGEPIPLLSSHAHARRPRQARASTCSRTAAMRTRLSSPTCSRWLRERIRWLASPQMLVSLFLCYPRMPMHGVRGKRELPLCACSSRVVLTGARAAVDAQARSLVHELFQPAPHARLTASAALEHEWYLSSAAGLAQMQRALTTS